MTKGKSSATNGNGNRKNLRALTHTSTHKNGKSKPILITGGAGFVGSNLAHRLLSAGHRVRLLDNLSRMGVERNLRWLMETHGDLVYIEFPNLRNFSTLNHPIKHTSQIFHFTPQLTITSNL